MSIAVNEWDRKEPAKFHECAGAIVIVDVLSFTTCVDIAISRGAIVYPFAHGDRHAAARMAKTVGAELAGPRGCNEYRFSLSPASLSEIVAGTKFVLPSPNGSTISAAAHRTPVLAGCLRNALAVARKAIAIARGSPVAVIPTGERWPDGSLRPAIEDLIGDGAIIDELGLRCSPEGEIARQAFRGALPAMAELLRGRTSGRELIDRGYPQDVEAAINSNVSPTTPLLVDGAYNV